jgi:putative oxidoreductase
MNAGRLIARVTIGGLFVGHGTQKLFGWFGGPGPEGAGQMMHKLELRPGRRNALAAGASEAAGGAMLALGALTPAAGALLSAPMFTAIRKVHFQKGIWNTGGGYEYNLVLIAALAALIECGPGSPSIDSALGIETRGSKWALAAVAAGAAGSALAIEAGRRVEDNQEEQQPQSAQPHTNGDRPEQVPAGSTA